MIEIKQAVTEPELDAVRTLMRAFVDWSRERYADYLAQVNAYFDAGSYGAELAGLPGNYAPPRGALLLATRDGKPAGCVAFRPFDAMSCEMKRMFVATDMQGQGVGRALASQLIREAKQAGYQRMLLDTGFLQVEAQTLYKSLGFVEIEPYYPIPAAARGGAIFMELQLEHS